VLAFKRDVIAQNITTGVMDSGLALRAPRNDEDYITTGASGSSFGPLPCAG
jgi:hypothetical protein